MSSIAATAELVWGYSMARIDRLADEAARKTSGGPGRLLDPVDAREEAWSGIVDLLYLTPEKPSEWSLVDAGARAIDDLVRINLRDQGLRPIKGQGGGYEEAPRFNAFWVHIVGAKPDWTDAIIERMALPKVLGVLTPAQYQAVAALAAHGSIAKAANALNIEYAALKHRVNAGRKKMLEAWFDDETPHTTSKADPSVKCRYGHSRAKHGFRNAAGVWACHVCLRAAARRRRAAGGKEALAVVDVPKPSPQLFPARSAATSEPVGVRHNRPGGGVVLGSSACWCGEPVGHDWDGRDTGAPHPAQHRNHAA